MKDNDGVRKTKTEGHPAQMREENMGQKRKKASATPHHKADKTSSGKGLSGLREDQPGRDSRGDRNSI